MFDNWLAGIAISAGLAALVVSGVLVVPLRRHAPRSDEYFRGLARIAFAFATGLAGLAIGAAASGQPTIAVGISVSVVVVAAAGALCRREGARGRA